MFYRMLILMAIVVPFSSAIGAEQMSGGHSSDRLTEQLNNIALKMSVLVSDAGNRGIVTNRLKDFSKTNAIALSDVVSAAARAKTYANKDVAGHLFEIAAATHALESMLAEHGRGVPRVDVILAENDYGDRLKSSREIYVAVSPPGDEDAIKEIVAFSNGKQMVLSADKAPSVPTIVILLGESKSLDNAYPLKEVDEPGKEADTEPVDDWLGVPYIRILNDHEPWHKGDPEIYIKWRTWFISPGVFRDNKVNLPGVNKTNRWYWLGDPNSTYIYLDERNYSTVELAVWESDWGSDDFLGVFFPTYTSLPFGGYTAGTPGGTRRDARVMLDRD